LIVKRYDRESAADGDVPIRRTDYMGFFEGGKPIERAVTRDTKELIEWIPREVSAELPGSLKQFLEIPVGPE